MPLKREVPAPHQPLFKDTYSNIGAGRSIQPGNAQLTPFKYRDFRAQKSMASCPVCLSQALLAYVAMCPA